MLLSLVHTRTPVRIQNIFYVEFFTAAMERHFLSPVCSLPTLSIAALVAPRKREIC